MPHLPATHPHVSKEHVPECCGLAAAGGRDRVRHAAGGHHRQPHVPGVVGRRRRGHGARVRRAHHRNQASRSRPVPPHAHERPGLEHHVVAERVGKAQLGRACCCTAVGGIGLAQCHRANEKGDSSSQELDGHMVARRGSPVLEAARPPVARPGPTIGPRGGALGGNPLEARSAVRAASDPSPDAPQQVAAICPCQGAMETRSWWQFLCDCHQLMMIDLGAGMGAGASGVP